MPLSDIECIDLLQQQYDCIAGVFDFQSRIGEVSVGVVHYPDCTAVCFEGSHNIPDWLSNFQCAMITVPDFGRIERGFYDSMPETAVVLQTYLQPGKPVISMGHSRGAAHANIYGLMLLKGGMAPAMVKRVKFGEPHSMDAETAKGFAGSIGISYWNYHDALRHDIVGSVPFYIPGIAPYVPSENRLIVDVAPPEDDSWGVVAWHHLWLYRQGWLKLRQDNASAADSIPA